MANALFAATCDFFMSLQLPDMSMDNMKAEDESDIWLELFDRETNVIKAYLAKMYPALADAFAQLEVEHVITPYQINDEGERLSNLSTATGGKPYISQRTAVKQAGFVDDVDAELDQLKAEEQSDITEPSF